VFNPLPAPEITAAVGRVLKQAASASDPPDDYQRSQLLSAYSITRHLAAEQAGGDEVVAWFRESLAAELEKAAAGDPPQLADPDAWAERIRSCPDGRELGTPVRDLLLALRRSRPDAEPLLSETHRLLREACDREVATLGAGHA
jgi:hypothetical protein